MFCSAIFLCKNAFFTCAPESVVVTEVETDQFLSNVMYIWRKQIIEKEIM